MVYCASMTIECSSYINQLCDSEGLTVENRTRGSGCGIEGWATSADIMTEAWRI